MKNLVLTISLITTVATMASAQVRPVGDDPRSTSVNVPAAQETFEAKYEGGMFGYSDKQSGKLKFDDINKRMVFLGKDGKEKFSLPYSAMQSYIRSLGPLRRTLEMSYAIFRFRVAFSAD